LRESASHSSAPIARLAREGQEKYGGKTIASDADLGAADREPHGTIPDTDAARAAVDQARQFPGEGAGGSPN
jgi:hypothetical protein